MFAIRPTSADDYIDCDAGHWVCQRVYAVKPGFFGWWRLNQAAYIVLDANLDPGCGDVELSAEYYLRPVGLPVSPFEIPIDLANVVKNQVALHKVFDLRQIRDMLNARSPGEFEFRIIIRQSVNVDHFIENGVVYVETSVAGSTRQLQLINKLPGVPLRHYPQLVGSLDSEIIKSITFVGRGVEGWTIKVDEIRRWFTPSQLESVVSDALRFKPGAPAARLHDYFREHFPELVGDHLPVQVTIPYVESDVSYQIMVHLYDPTDLFYPTGNSELDLVMKEIERQLIDDGLSLSATDAPHQEVLKELLLYRLNCLTIAGYMPNHVIRSHEVGGFHTHLYEKLDPRVRFSEPPTVSEPEVARSKVDLLIKGFPTELKLEDRRSVTTDQIIDMHQSQAADYISKYHSPFGFLVILDTVVDRKEPVPPVLQDVRVVPVRTMSGGHVTVIGIVVRPPRPASRL